MWLVPSHYVEDKIGIYVKRDPAGTDTWVAEGVAEHLEYPRPENGNCECGDTAECDATRNRMELVPLPSERDLIEQLAALHGFKLVPFAVF